MGIFSRKSYQQNHLTYWYLFSDVSDKNINDSSSLLFILYCDSEKGYRVLFDSEARQQHPDLS